MSAVKRPRTDANGYETDDTVSDDEHSSHPQDEVHNSLLKEIEILKNEVRRLTGNLHNMPPTPPTERINKSGERLYIYEKVNDLYTNPGEKYKGADLYKFLPLTRDVNKDETVYNKDGKEFRKENLFGNGGKGRRTTHRKCRKRGGNKKSCKRTKKR
tara:strand:+ start:123 stop:593 length:471 start_codon:yes stop_codon:yes gene_type:complete